VSLKESRDGVFASGTGWLPNNKVADLIGRAFKVVLPGYAEDVIASCGFLGRRARDVSKGVEMLPELLRFKTFKSRLHDGSVK
jgi:hypothetical protein